MVVVIVLACGDVIETQGDNVVIGQRWEVLTFVRQVDGYYFVNFSNIVDMRVSL